QAAPTEPFKWRERPRAWLRRWQSTSTFDYVDADHGAYFSLPDPVRHRRRVFFAKPRFFVVVDDLHGMDVYDIELRFQFAPTAVTVELDGWVQTHAATGRGLLLRAFPDARIQARLHVGNTAPIRGWVSADYGQRTPAPQLVCTMHTKLPQRIVTLMLP